MHDGAVLPVLHLNGYKIAGPTVLARIPRSELNDLLCGLGHRPYFVEGDDPAKMHQLMAATLDEVVGEIRRIQTDARTNGFTTRPRWPMIVLNSPKGWTGPATVDGKKTEGSFRSHQVPLSGLASNPISSSPISATTPSKSTRRVTATAKRRGSWEGSCAT